MKKRMLVYNVAADGGGAKTVLDSFYHEMKQREDFEYIFVTSVLNYEQTENLRNIRLPWVKKSWFHRLYCDYVYMPRLIKRVKADEILSLQNIAVPRSRLKQSLYVQNVLPFTEHRFSLRKDPFLWLYQNIIGQMIRKSVKKADQIIVQTDWMKEEIKKQCNIPGEKISVKKIPMPEKKDVLRENSGKPIFFYPTTPYRYKNSELVVQACKVLKEDGIHDYEVFLTLHKEENALSRMIFAEATTSALPIRMVGRLNSTEMEQMYRKSILLFPSYLETIGLPLAEAKVYGAPILAADCKYARETLGEYAGVCYFDYKDAKTLAEEMRKFCV